MNINKLTVINHQKYYFDEYAYPDLFQMAKLDWDNEKLSYFLTIENKEEFIERYKEYIFKCYQEELLLIQKPELKLYADNKNFLLHNYEFEIYLNELNLWMEICLNKIEKIFVL